MYHALKLCDANAKEIDRGIFVLEELPVELYASCVGKHYRHIIDFYQAFFDGYDSKIVNFHDRRRNHQLETCLESGKDALENITLRLKKFSTEDIATPLFMQDEIAQGIYEDIPATLGSVLHFLLSHTTHHYGIINQLVKESGESLLPAGFGYSPSTLSYLKNQEQTPP